MAVLAENYYGKSQVRLLKVVRRPAVNHVFDWTLGVYLTGDFEACYREGDNSGVLATDTMKNTVYAVASTSSAETPEAFALELAGFLARRNPQAASIRITVEEKLWMRLKEQGEDGPVAATEDQDRAERKGKHPTAFLQRGPELATTAVELVRGSAARVVSGVRGLVIMKTADSAFEGFLRDELTTLPNASDRLLATEATIEWVYLSAPADPAGLRAQVMDTLLTAVCRA